MKFRPVQDWLLIEKVETASSQKIVMPQNVTHEWTVGKVLDVGPGKYSLTGELVTPLYKVGQKVVFAGTAAMEVKVGDEEITMIGSQNVVAVIED